MSDLDDVYGYGGPRHRGDRGPVSMKFGVERVMKHLAAPETNTVRALFESWPELVGEVVGKNSRPQRVVEGTLHIEVLDQAWASELEWMSEMLLKRLSKALHGDRINAIEVHLAKQR